MVISLRVQLLDRCIDAVIHRLSQIAQEPAGDTGDHSKWNRDDEDNPNGVGKGLLQGTSSLGNDCRSDPRNFGQRRSVTCAQGFHERWKGGGGQSGSRCGLCDIFWQVVLQASIEGSGIDRRENGTGYGA